KGGLFLYTRVGHLYQRKVGSALSVEVYDLDRAVDFTAVVVRVVEQGSPDAERFPAGLGVRIVEVEDGNRTRPEGPQSGAGADDEHLPSVERELRARYATMIGKGLPGTVPPRIAESDRRFATLDAPADGTLADLACSLVHGGCGRCELAAPLRAPYAVAAATG